ncbi:MAG: TlpA disulfide reductase family protein [Nibricoccus sp.]
MKMLRLMGALAALACLVTPSFAADPKPAAAEKSPADLAYDQVVKLIDDKDAKQDQARLNAVSKAGIEFLIANPSYPKAGTVVDKMMRWTSVLKDKQRGMRSIFYAQVQGELLTPLFDEKLSEESKAAVLALDTAMSEGLFRENAVQATLVRWREKLDAQMKQKSVRDLLKDRAASYYDVLCSMNPGASVKFLGEAAASDDKNTANWAKAESKFVEVRKTPFELSFTALDGTAVNVAEKRGRIVCLFFWSAGTKDLTAKTDVLRDQLALQGEKKFSVIGVCVDKEADREKVVAAVKDMKMKWPTYFDGQGDAGELCKKLNVTTKSLPVMLVFDQQGKLSPLPAGKLSFDQKALEAELTRLTQPPAKKK